MQTFTIVSNAFFRLIKHTGRIHMWPRMEEHWPTTTKEAVDDKMTKTERDKEPSPDGSNTGPRKTGMFFNNDNNKVGDQGNVTKTLVAKPRVGCVEDGVAWTGSGNLAPSDGPMDTLALHPRRSREKLTQRKLLKEGLDKEDKLDIDVNTDTKKVKVNVWILDNLSSFLLKGFDKIFRTCAMAIDKDGMMKLCNEVFILEKWG